MNEWMNEEKILPKGLQILRLWSRVDLMIAAMLETWHCVWDPTKKGQWALHVL